MSDAWMEMENPYFRNRSSSAYDPASMKIQKVWKGFFVRKSLKKVREIRVEVDEISKSEVVRDERERIRLNEVLMSLLFKLDSICGVDLGVRACRKSVIRKVIDLQERIDAIVAAPHSQIENSTRSNLEGCIENLKNVSCGEAAGINVDVDVGGVKVSEESNAQNLDADMGLCEGDNKKDKNDNGKRNRELQESEKMTKLMTQLVDRNEMQTKMLNALTNRVELLENAFVCDRRWRRKKKTKITLTCKEN